MDFGQPNAVIGWKMANGRLLFLALQPKLTFANQIVNMKHSLTLLYKSPLHE